MHIFIHAEDDGIARIIFFNYDNTRANRTAMVLLVAASLFANGKLQIFVIRVRS